MFQLKTYQKEAITTLDTYFKRSRQIGLEAAYLELRPKTQSRETYSNPLGPVPYVCLRLPTGGGKTFLGSHSVLSAQTNWLRKEYPLVLWFVPSNTIRYQTLEALQKPNHPYREALDKAYNGAVMVIDITDVNQIRPVDLQQKAVIVVGTLATLRIGNTDGRKIYEHHEDFEPHFSSLAGYHSENLERDEATQKVKASFVNICSLNRPVVIMDEAHNARTPLTFDVLAKVSPACVIELTATPDLSSARGSNVIHFVTASELKSENMIKLPIRVVEHHDWMKSVQAAVETNKWLFGLAKNEKEYIRPIVLFQAESKEKSVTVEVLKKHLIETEQIPENEIAVATGIQRELDDINLFDPACSIKYIITVEALKEGWDCSFAYVFCSVASVKSTRDAEQLLGRVLRMPYAKERNQPDLNRAYAHLASPHFTTAVNQLRDSLIEMGFEETEVSAFVQPGLPLPLFETQPDLKIPLQSEITLTSIKSEFREQISLSIENEQQVLVVSGTISEELEKHLLTLVRTDRDVARLQGEIKKVRLSQLAANCPSERNETFSVPNLAWQEGDQLILLDEELFLELGEWNLLSVPPDLNASEFTPSSDATGFELDIQNHKVQVKTTGQFTLLEGNPELAWSELTLISWLDKQTAIPDIPQSVNLEFIRRVVEFLLKNRDFTMEKLTLFRYDLVISLKNRVQFLKKQTLNTGFQQALFKQTDRIRVDFTNEFIFLPGHYPARNPYKGHYTFSKHFYPFPDDLYGQEEQFCALAIDTHPLTKYWVRNLVREGVASFSLPTSKGRFYPDFIALLTDGRYLVVEYKGEHLKTADDAKEKEMVGLLWEKQSQRKCLFLMAVDKDQFGRDVKKQIEEKVRI